MPGVGRLPPVSRPVLLLPRQLGRVIARRAPALVSAVVTLGSRTANFARLDAATRMYAEALAAAA
jgi:hypothetical protein